MGHSIDIVPMPFARSRAPENVLMQSTPARSSSCATRPLPALAMNTGTRRATLARSFSRMSARDVRGTITGTLQTERRKSPLEADQSLPALLDLLEIHAGHVLQILE